MSPDTPVGPGDLQHGSRSIRSYSSDGESRIEFETLEEAVAAADELLELYNVNDGEPCDVDSQWEIYEEGGDDPVKTIKLEYSVNKAAQEACTLIASRKEEYETTHLGVNPDGDLVVWTSNGGTKGAHDRMDSNKGHRVPRYEHPRPMIRTSFLKLMVSYDCNIETIMSAFTHEDLQDLESDAETQTQVAHWLDADGTCWKFTCFAYPVSSSQYLAWSHTDEGGIDDIALITKSCWTDFAETTAATLGEVVDVESGEHFSTHGVQYAHQAPGDYDPDGFRVVIVKR